MIYICNIPSSETKVGNFLVAIVLILPDIDAYFREMHDNKQEIIQTLLAERVRLKAYH